MGNHFSIPHVDCVRLNRLVAVTCCALFPFCPPHSRNVECNWTILICTVTVYTQNLHLQQCVCVCVSISGARSFFVVGAPLPWAQAASEKKKKERKKWSSTIALMLWCLQGGVRAAELPAERTETYASVPLTAQISVRDRLRLTRANTHTVTGESGANVHKRTEWQKLTRRYRCGYQKRS